MIDSVQLYLSAHPPRTPRHFFISTLLLSLFRKEFWRFSERGDIADDNARRSSSNSGGGTAGSAMGSSHPHTTMPMVRCNAMAWTDETEDGGWLKVLLTRSDSTIMAGATVVRKRYRARR
jgi:hypothetical protein